jgi:hypothetical protein
VGLLGRLYFDVFLYDFEAVSFCEGDVRHTVASPSP